MMVFIFNINYGIKNINNQNCELVNVIKVN